jgi:hypothetical protein
MVEKESKRDREGERERGAGRERGTIVKRGLLYFEANSTRYILCCLFLLLSGDNEKPR